MAAAESSELRAVAEELLRERDRRRALEAVVLDLAAAAGVSQGGLIEPETPLSYSEALARPVPVVEHPEKQLRRYVDTGAADGIYDLPEPQRSRALAARQANLDAINADDPYYRNRHLDAVKPARRKEPA